VVLSVVLKVLQPQFSKNLNWRFFDSENDKKTWNWRFFYSEKFPKNEEN
jgi:3-deoxy-D-manno-octulosonic-acid transferase